MKRNAVATSWLSILKNSDGIGSLHRRNTMQIIAKEYAISHIGNRWGKWRVEYRQISNRYVSTPYSSFTVSSYTHDANEYISQSMLFARKNGKNSTSLFRCGVSGRAQHNTQHESWRMFLCLNEKYHTMTMMWR